MKGAERGRILLRAAHLLRERVKSLAEIEVYDTGKPISEAVSVDIPSAAEAIEYFAGLASSLHGDHLIWERALYTPVASHLEFAQELEHGIIRYKLQAGKQPPHSPVEMQ
jgi:acyl-CoA reductase-like NAD-dependent aldehyde dehydrogenase